jgi:HK97 family phage major capsid protein
MNLAERIVAAETALVTSKDSLNAAVKALEAAPNEESLLMQVEELTGSVEKQTTTIGALRKAEKALASRAAPAGTEGGPGAPAIIPNMNHLRTPKGGGELMWKHATAKLLAHVEKKSVDQVIEERYPDDNRVKATLDFISKSAEQIAVTSVPSWAGELVQEDVRGFMGQLTDVSVAAQLITFVQNFDFGGYGSIKIPNADPIGNELTEPAWVGEGGVIPVTSFGFGSMTLNPYKLAAITTMSKEITTRSTPAIEGIVRELMRNAYAKVVDHAILTPTINAVAGVRPASPFYGVTPLVPAAGLPEENVRADILTLLKAMTVNKLGQRPVLIANNLNVLSAGMMVNVMGDFLYKTELNANRLLGLPKVSSGHVPLDMLAALDGAFIAMALGGIEFDVSDVATITEANADGTPPSQALPGEAGRVGPNGGLAVGAAGVQSRSLWQTYSLGIRMVAHLSWGKTNPNAAQFMTGINWG